MMAGSAHARSTVGIGLGAICLMEGIGLIAVSH